MAEKKPYEQRTDSEKIFDNWSKTLGLLERNEYSVAIVRAAVTVELAANFVVRAELVEKRKLPATFVDHLLIWSNGLQGKFEKLIYPILKGSVEYDSFKRLSKDWKKINTERNSVAHSGQFKNKETAEEIVSLARMVVKTLVSAYHPDFKIGATKSKHLKLGSTKSSIPINNSPST